VFLLKKETAQRLKEGPPRVADKQTGAVAPPGPTVPQRSGPEETEVAPPPEPPLVLAAKQMVRVVGTLPPELWNRLGTKILPKLRSGEKLQVGIDLVVMTGADTANDLKTELRQILLDLGVAGSVRVE